MNDFAAAMEMAKTTGVSNVFPSINSNNNGRLIEKTKTFTAEVEDSQTELNGLKQSTMGNSNPFAGIRIR